MEEPFSKNQTGSSAMAYKRNPMRSERMTSLSRKLINMQLDFSHTHSNQWFERSLDDSAIRRIDIPQTFLLCNAVLKLYQNITDGIVVNEAIIDKYIKEELAFMTTEVILMELSRKGKSRQEMHKIIKKHSVDAGKKVKEGKRNDLIERIVEDKNIDLDEKELKDLLDNPDRFSGLAKEQTENFLRKEIDPVIKKYSKLIDQDRDDIDV